MFWIPSYGGVTLFGEGVSIVIQDTDPDVQENSYPGVSGVETTHLGNRGRFAIATGTHRASDPQYLVALQTIFRSYKDGIARPLVDTAGATWFPVLLRTFDPQGKRLLLPNGQSVQQYRAVFRITA
jgi:hypothetical protein